MDLYLQCPMRSLYRKKNNDEKKNIKKSNLNTYIYFLNYYFTDTFLVLQQTLTFTPGHTVSVKCLEKMTAFGI